MVKFSTIWTKLYGKPSNINKQLVDCSVRLFFYVRFVNRVFSLKVEIQALVDLITISFKLSGLNLFSHNI